MDITLLLKQLDDINLPKDNYAITSSGVLALHGIREANDLDIIVTPKLWEELTKKYEVVTEGDLHSIYIEKIQILGEGSYFNNPKIATAEEQIAEAEIIKGYPCVKLQYIKAIKQVMTREKDKRDVELIEKYLGVKQ